MSNCLASKFEQTKAFHLCAVLIVHWGKPVYYKAGSYFISVFAWTHFAIQFVACMCSWTDNVV